VENPQRCGLRPLDATALDPFLRALVLEDRMVTRALRDHASAEIKVSVEEQTQVPVPSSCASLLKVSAGSPAVRRRVAIAVDRSPAPALLAESLIVPDRLPPEFLASLAASAEGIGIMLESFQTPVRRDLLCCGLSEGVPWRPGFDVGPVALRRYRIVAEASPAILITEAFLLEAADGRLRLANVAPGLASQA
jgi:chorismate-pyruvate lyase